MNSKDLDHLLEELETSTEHLDDIRADLYGFANQPELGDRVYKALCLLTSVFTDLERLQLKREEEENDTV